MPSYVEGGAVASSSFVPFDRVSQNHFHWHAYHSQNAHHSEIEITWILVDVGEAVEVVDDVVDAVVDAVVGEIPIDYAAAGHHENHHLHHACCLAFC